MQRPFDIPLSILVLGLFLLQAALTHAPGMETNKYLNPPPQYIERFAFGFNASLADSLWLRWIQDGGDCQVYGTPVKEAPPATEPAGKKDLLVDNVRHRVCDNSWSYYMLDAISKLDPRFKMPYIAGLVVLTVLVEDYKGATVLYERALAAYPDDWQLNYEAAYHFLFDIKDLPRAAKLLVHAADTGAPSWLRSLAARLYSRTGQLDLGISALEAYERTVTNEKEKAQVQSRLDELRAQREHSQ